jgi:hypothetical protein
MAEKQREVPRLGGSGGGPGIWDDPTAFASGTATVAHGPYAENLPVVGMTVESVRRRFSDRLDIDPGSQAFVNGQPVPEDHRLETGQVLMFARRAGEKGRARMSAGRAGENARVRISARPAGEKGRVRVSGLPAAGTRRAPIPAPHAGAKGRAGS